MSGQIWGHFWNQRSQFRGGRGGLFLPTPSFYGQKSHFWVLDPPKKGGEGRENLTPLNFWNSGPYWVQNCKKINFSTQILREYIAHPTIWLNFSKIFDFQKNFRQRFWYGPPISSLHYRKKTFLFKIAGGAARYLVKFGYDKVKYKKGPIFFWPSLYKW